MCRKIGNKLIAIFLFVLKYQDKCENLTYPSSFDAARRAVACPANF